MQYQLGESRDGDGINLSKSLSLTLVRLACPPCEPACESCEGLAPSGPRERILRAPRPRAILVFYLCRQRIKRE
eukprot:2583613-Pyramimonas_sp.AAC.2